MGREIRKVPKNWEHPKSDRGYGRGMEFTPLYDQDYLTEITEWIKNHELWLKGEHEDQKEPDGCKEKFYAEWGGDPPHVEAYRPAWTEPADHFQVYETVSEGTPVSPVFATKEEMIEYLVANGDFWDQRRGNGGWSRSAAEGFVKFESCPSLIIANGKVMTGPESCAEIVNQ
jgi:hypothetical protein